MCDLICYMGTQRIHDQQGVFESEGVCDFHLEVVAARDVVFGVQGVLAIFRGFDVGKDGVEDVVPEHRLLCGKISIYEGISEKGEIDLAEVVVNLPMVEVVMLDGDLHTEDIKERLQHAHEAQVAKSSWIVHVPCKVG